MTEQEGLNKTRTQVEAEFQAFKDTNPGNKYPYSSYLDHFYGLFITRGKRSRNQIEGTPWMTPERQKLYKLADQELEQEGIHKEQIEQFVQQQFRAFESGNDNAYCRSREEMTQMLWPVYIRLRILGYPHTDLA